MATTGTALICFSGLGLFVTIKLTPLEDRISDLERDIKEVRTIGESIHEIKTDFAVMKNDLKHLIEYIKENKK